MSFEPEFFFPAEQINADAKTDSQLLQAARVTAHWKAGDMRVMPDLSESPLFGGPKQTSLFCDYCDSIEAMTGTRNCPIHNAEDK